ncbi:30S ribosomal protein S17e, partial [Candidatus Woesearchaeota archaeon]|nr:30S ribosomal protein S17e [Candidatus Woesearchaeota archaeon]
MGRIKTKLVKRITFDLLQSHEDHLSDDFEHNKAFINDLLDRPNKKLR